MNKIFLFILFSGFFLFYQINAQSSLSGHIRGKNDQEKLSGANVYIPILQRGAVSDAEGFYKIEKLPEGNFQVQFSFIGYRSIILEANLKEGSNSLDTELEEADIEIGEVVVLGNSVDEIEKAPYKVEKTSVDESRADGFTTLQNSLTLLPGVSELSNGLSISKPVIRGLSGYRTAAIVSGLRFDNQEWQNEHGFGVNDVGTGSIEIVEGPAALLYGANVIGGAVNYLDPVFAAGGKTNGIAAVETFSNTLGANARVSLKGSGESLRWQFHLGGESHADYLAGKERKIPNTRFAGISAKGILNYSYASGFSTLDYSFAHNIFGIVEEADLNNPKDQAEEHFEREFEGPHHIIDYHIISLQNLFLAGNSKIKLNLGFQNNHREEEEGQEAEIPGAVENALDVMLNTFSYDAEWIYPVFEKSELTIGTQGQIQNNENEGKRILVPNADMNEFSGFSYLKKDFENIIIEGGIRYDISTIKTEETGLRDSAGFMNALDLNFGTINGALGISYFPNQNWIFKLNFATGFRSPNLAELSSNGVHEGTTRYEIGNPDMKNEQNFQTDFGITFLAENFKLGANGFFNSVRHFIFLAATDSFIQINKIYRFMQNDAGLYGGEIILDLKPDRLIDFTASYSIVIGKEKGGAYLPFMPADKVLAEAVFNLPESALLTGNKLTLRGRGYLEQNREAGNETSTPGYFLLDAGIRTQVHLNGIFFRLALNATNILDKVYVNHLSLLKPLGIPDIGRNISLALEVPFDF